MCRISLSEGRLAGLDGRSAGLFLLLEAVGHPRGDGAASRTLVRTRHGLTVVEDPGGWRVDRGPEPSS